MAIYTVTITGIDVSRWIRDIPAIPRNKGSLGTLADIPGLTLVGDNTKQVWNPEHPNSVLDANWRGEPVVVTINGDRVYEGEMRNVILSEEGRVATIELTSRINRILSTNFPFYYADLLTFAEISASIYASFGINWDSTSYARAKVQQQYYGLQARTSINPGAQLSLLTCQQFLANAGFCRHYFVKNVAYMDFIDPYTARTSMGTIVDDDILDISDYSLIEQDDYNGYQVQTATGLAIVNGSTMAPTLELGADKPFIMPTPAGGHEWGKLMIAYSEGNKYSITTHLAKGQITSWLDLDSIITINSAKFGINKQFEVISIDDSNRLGPIVTGESL